MKRRQLLMWAGGTTVSTLVVGATAPPAQALFPLRFRFLVGQGVRQAIRDRRKGKKTKKSVRGRWRSLSARESARRPRASYRGSTLKSRRSGVRKVKTR